MQCFAKIRVSWTSLALLVAVTGSAAAQDSSIIFTKTVGLDPNECATSNVLPQVPEDGVVYYCYQITYTGVISASCHTLTDSVLGSVLDNIPGSRCCTDASGTDCAEPINKCNQEFVGECPNEYPVCASVTFPGVCCNDEEGTDCPIPHEGCIDDSECPSGSSNGNYCVTNPVVANGEMATRVITATVPAQGVANTATWTAQAGICCSDMSSSCDGDDFPDPCATDDDCGDPRTCRKAEIGLCCDPSNPTSCDPEKVCLGGDTECVQLDPNDPFTDCNPLDTTAEEQASARVGVLDTPALSAGALAVAVLMLVGVGLRRIRRDAEA